MVAIGLSCHFLDCLGVDALNTLFLCLISFALSVPVDVFLTCVFRFDRYVVLHLKALHCVVHASSVYAYYTLSFD